MIVDSTAKCVQTYHVGSDTVHIIPGRNLIRDDVGRGLMKNQGFLDMVHTKALGFQKTVIVTVPPGEDPATAKPVPGGKTPIVPKDGETAVTNMTVAQAVEAINECKVVDQLQDIMTRDPRAGVKTACSKRIAVLAAEIESGKGADDDETDDQDDTTE